MTALTTKHFFWCIYNQVLWYQERTYNLSRIRNRDIYPSTGTNYIAIKTGNKLRFPSDTPLSCLGEILAGCTKNEKSYQVLHWDWLIYSLRNGFGTT